MKKIIVFLLSLALLLALAACGDQNPTTTNSKPSDGSKPSVTDPTTPTDPSGPSGGDDEIPQKPELSEYEKTFYQLFEAGQQVNIHLEDLDMAISVNAEENLLLVCLSQSNVFDQVPTLEGECEGNFGMQFQMLYQGALVAGDNHAVTCLLRENKMFLKLSGDFTEEIAQKHLEYMNAQDITQEQKDALAAALAGEAVEGYNILGGDVSIGFSAKVDGGVYTDIRVDCYDGEEIECYFLVLADAIHQIMEYGTTKRTIAYDFDGNILFEERTDGEQTLRISYIYNDASQLIREECYMNGKLMDAHVEYTYDEAGVLTGKLSYNGEVLTSKVLYDKNGEAIAELEYDEAGNILWGYETILDADGKPVERISYSGDNEKVVHRYDENGKEVLITFYNADGEAYQTYENTFYENGEMSQKICRYANGAYYVEIYDEEGRSVSWMDYNSQGELTTGYNYTYNENGDTIQCVTYEGDERSERNWDDAGNVLSYYRYRKDVLVEWQINTYNEDNLILSTVEYGEISNDEIGFLGKYLYTYDENGLLIRSETYYDEHSQVPDLMETFTYDENGNQLCNYRYNNEGVLWGWNEYTYNEDGLPLTWIHYRGEGTEIVERREEWLYDVEGNCIRNLSFNQNGDIIMGFANEYDEDGKLVGSISYTTDSYEVTQYIDNTYATCHVYDRETDQLLYWIELILENGEVIDQIFHD